MDHSIKPISTLSLCTGMRGLERGVESAVRFLRYIYGIQQENAYRGNALKIIADVEIEAVIAWNLVTQMEQGVLDPTLVWTDLKTFPYEHFHGKVCLLTGGYPCQPFSSAGKQDGVLDPRHLFPYIERGIDAIRPVLCYFENVANHLNIGYQEVRSKLQNLGYTVEEGIFSAEQVGATHIRRRLFILAVANTYCDADAKRRGDLAKILGLQAVSEQKHGSAIPDGNRQVMENTKGKRIRRGHYENQGGDGCELQTPGSSPSLGDLNDQRQQQSEGDIGEGRRRTEHTSEVVVNSESISQRKSSDQADAISDERQAWNEFGHGSKILDDTERQRLERLYRHGSATARWEESVRSIAASSFWPAGQGEYQHSWEPSRLESRMGYEFNGYNFTEDLLRMAGNAVVEQQSMLAFITLLQKFI